MFLTEQEATRKRCPAAGLSDRCIATACMAWRWNDAEKPSTIWPKFVGIGYLGNIGIETMEAAKAKPRPDHVPSHWQITDDGEGHIGYEEPEAEFEARKAKHIAEWPDKRKGFCGYVPTGAA